MNRYSLTAATLLGLASFAAAAGPMPTLETVQVRPSPEQIAERAGSPIVTLETVQVRPSSEQVARRDIRRIVELAPVEVRPTAEQIAERGASVATLATIRVRPSAAQIAIAHGAGAAKQERAFEFAELIRGAVESALKQLPAPELRMTAADPQWLVDHLGQAALGNR